MLTLGFVLALVRPGPVNDGLAINPFGIPETAGASSGGVGAARLGTGAGRFADSRHRLAVGVRYRRGRRASSEPSSLVPRFATSPTAILLCLSSSATVVPGRPRSSTSWASLASGCRPSRSGLSRSCATGCTRSTGSSAHDRLGCVTAILVAVVRRRVIGLQGRARQTSRSGDTVAVAASTLVVARAVPADPQAGPADRRPALRPGTLRRERTVDAFAEQTPRRGGPGQAPQNARRDRATTPCIRSAPQCGCALSLGQADEQALESATSVAAR